MRTVTFSDPAVAARLNKDFICTWVNREPGFHNCDLSAERMISEYESFSTRNFCTFFTTAEQDALHYASGYYRLAMFMKELDFVMELKGAVLDLRNRYLEDAYPEFKELHYRHVRMHEREDERIAESEPPKEKKGQGRNKGNREHHRSGLRHLTDVHRDLVSKSWNADGPVPLKAVFKDHLFGNPFQESGDRGKVKRGPGENGPGMKKP